MWAIKIKQGKCQLNVQREVLHQQVMTHDWYEQDIASVARIKAFFF